jgi:hypothetical protein
LNAIIAQKEVEFFLPQFEFANQPTLVKYSRMASMKAQ